VYAANLAEALAEAHSNIRVSTVNPYTIHTAIATHPNPIYTQPVDTNGLSVPTDPQFDAGVAFIRDQLVAISLSS
jgi:hypothetical protein